MRPRTFSGRGTQHSERNGSADEPMRFIQFWIIPSNPDLRDGVQQRQYQVADRLNRWLVIMSPPGQEGLDLQQDARVATSRLEPGHALAHDFAEGRGGYLYAMDGAGTVNGEELRAGDAVKVTEGPEVLEVEATRDLELIVIDVPLKLEPVGIWRGRV